MNLSNILNTIKQLPPAPEVLPQLLTILNEDPINLNEVVQLIHLDPSLTAQVLKSANTNGTIIHNLHDAAEKLGVKFLSKLVIAISSKGIIDKSIANYGLEHGHLWEKSIAAAIIMESLAHRIAATPEDAYLVGILHNIGKLAMNQLHGEDYRKVHQHAEDKGMQLALAEKTTFGYNHAEIGATLLQHWNFTEDIWMPIDYQFRPLDIPQKHYQKMACALNACNWMIHYIDPHGTPNTNTSRLDPHIADFIQFSPSELHSHILLTQEKIDEMRCRFTFIEQ